MPRLFSLGFTAFGTVVLIGCSSDARPTEPSTTAVPVLSAPSFAPSDSVFRPSSATEVNSVTRATPTSRPAQAEQAVSPARPTGARNPQLEPAGTQTPQAGPEPVRTLPRDRDLPLEYVALGDSTVEGVGASSPDKNYVGRLHARLKAQYPAAKVDNLGVAGATSADVARQQLPKAVALRPTLVTLSVGPNDITQGRSIEEYEQNVDRILATLARETDAVVVVNTLPDMAVSPIFKPEEKPVVGALARAYSDVLAQKADQYGAVVVELYAPSQDEVPANAGLLAADNYHPSDAGYARWADFMWRGVEARLAERG